MALSPLRSVRPGRAPRRTPAVPALPVLLASLVLAASDARAADVVLSGATSGASPICAGALAGVSDCDVSAVGDGQVVFTLSLDASYAPVNGYDLTVAWDAAELTLLSCTALYPDSQPLGTVPFLLSPCDAADPSGSDAVALSIVGFESQALLSLTFGLVEPTAVGFDGLADIAWAPNGSGLSPGSLVLTNPAGAGIDVGTVVLAHCQDGIDNDGDGLTDFGVGLDNDLGCASASDDSERAEQHQCDDGIDNDGDGKIDFTPPEGGTKDPGCTNFTDHTEDELYGECSDGLDNDGDGLVDFGSDPGCPNALTAGRENPACDDGFDNDRDGFIDFPDDPECARASQDFEAPQCSDGLDNDNDGKVDHPADPDCTSPSLNSEFSSSCGLLGVEPIFVLAWSWSRRRRSGTSR